MIARVLYRQNVHGVLNYVFGKGKSTVLGFQNTYSDTNTNKEFFGNVLYHLGNRHDSEKRYVHATINLPREEHLNDRDFFELSKNYMEHMGYGAQPFVVVRHNDTKHEHVHIVSTTIKEDGSIINLSNDFRRNMATQKHLEKQYGLSPSPETKEQKELPIYEIPKIKKSDVNGVRFYIQDILNNTLQKYNLRSFDELAELVKPHHIIVRPVKKNNGRIGVSYGISIENGYKSRFINGSTVHPKLSGSKLQKVFERNQSSKLLPMVKKRLEKQIRTTYNLFKTINPEQLPEILKSYQKLDCKVDLNKAGKAVDFSIYDKSGFVLKTNEISNHIEILQNLKLFESGYTQMDIESDQLGLKLQKCIKEAFKTTYRNTRGKVLFSEHIDRAPNRMVSDAMAESERFMFLKKYLHTDKENLSALVKLHYNSTKEELQNAEFTREEKQLKEKAELIKMVIASGLFDLKAKKGLRLELLESVGVRYSGKAIRHVNSSKHREGLNLGNLQFPDRINFHASPGFVKENEKVLDGLLNQRTEKEIVLSPTAIFLPLMFPNLYEAMAREYRIKFEILSIKAYMKHAQYLHGHFEKSPEDYIRFFNAKGFYFNQREGKLYINSIYSKVKVDVELAPKVQAYLLSSNGINKTLENQPNVLQDIKNNGQDHLKCLWTSYLIERGQYKKAAYLMLLESAKANLPIEILNFHLDNGLRETLREVSRQRLNTERARLLQKGLYALSTLLGSKKPKEEVIFNGFKDELTDYSKYKGKGISI